MVKVMMYSAVVIKIFTKNYFKIIIIDLNVLHVKLDTNKYTGEYSFYLDI